jgi:hypothetical protein
MEAVAMEESEDGMHVQHIARKVGMEKSEAVM